MADDNRFRKRYGEAFLARHHEYPLDDDEVTGRCNRSSARSATNVQMGQADQYSSTATLCSAAAHCPLPHHVNRVNSSILGVVKHVARTSI